MSERLQRTAASMREIMHHRYDDGLHHKHDKCHLPYRAHWRSHPAHLMHAIDENPITLNTPWLHRQKKCLKMRKRFDKARSH